MGSRQVGRCQGAGSYNCRVRTASPVERRAWAGTKGPLPLPQPCARAQRQRWGSAPFLPGGNKDRLSHKNKTEPARGLLHTSCGLGQPSQAPASPGEPQEAQPRVPSAPFTVLPALCLPGEGLDTLSLAKDLLPG